DGAIGAAPSQDEHFAFFGAAVQLLGRDIIGNFFYFLFADLYHQLMVLRIIAYVAGDVLLFETADAMFQAWRSGDGPWSYQLFIPEVGLEFLFAMSQFRLEFYFYGEQVFGLREFPGFGAVGDISVTEED